MAQCRWCGADPSKDSTVALTRVNEKGVEGIWECIPYCKEGEKKQNESSLPRN